MARCTAPVCGHHTASGTAACPACGGRYSGYSSYWSYSSPSYSSSGRRGGGSGSSAIPHWSRPGSSVLYTPAKVRVLTAVRDSIEKRVPRLTQWFTGE